ncbi:MAG: rhomboid family intramembrane serine protease [Nitrososphaeria archaeon]|nr:rhomboid family intramembrane serine protease [Nitrososphaeria archaeon]NIQ33802.1 rhomboid family intramembrane serine protease [Nitrososphaeria archaeon]
MQFGYEPPKWTFIFIGVCVAAFLIQNLTDYWIYLAFIPAYAFIMPWMFLSSIFLHADLSHLFFNMFALFFFGIYLERMVGRRVFAALFLVSGILGNVGHMLTVPNPYIPAVGASGAIYGIIGSLAILTPFLMVFVYGLLPVPMIVAALLWALLDLFGLFNPSGIAHGAHLLGMLAGVTYGLYLRMSVRRRIRY